MAPKTQANSSRRTQHEEHSIEAYKERIAQLENEREKSRSRFQEKLDTSNRETQAAKSEIRRLNNELKNSRAEVETFEKAYKQLNHEKGELRRETDEVRYEWEMCEKKYVRLKASYDNLKLRYEAVPEDRKNPMIATLPERKRQTGSGSSGSGPSMTSSAAARAQMQQRQQEAEEERGRSARKQAEKDRLGQRFEKRPPPSSGNRNSYIEGFGPRRRSNSTASAMRIPLDHIAQTTRYDEPLMSHREPVAYSTAQVPRRIPSTTGYHSGGSAIDDYEDGNYHMRPL